MTCAFTFIITFIIYTAIIIYYHCDEFNEAINTTWQALSYPFIMGASFVASILGQEKLDENDIPDPEELATLI